MSIIGSRNRASVVVDFCNIEPPVAEVKAGKRDPAPASDLTRGPIASTLLAFAVPTLLSNLLQPLTGSINSMWVGRYLGEGALAAISNANIIIFLLLSLFFGIGMATAVLIAQCFGARDLTVARKMFGAAVGFCAVLAIALATCGWIWTPKLLELLGTPHEAHDLARQYLRTLFPSMPFGLIGVILMMGLRGSGDARTPLWYMLFNATLDLILNPFFIFGLGPIPPLGIIGSGAATGAAAVVSLVGLVVYAYLANLPLCLRGHEVNYILPKVVHLRTLLSKGVPMGLQTIAMSLSSLIMMGFVNREGLETSSAYGACQQLWNYLQAPAIAMGAAVSAMAAQNMGAGHWDRVNRTALCGTILLLPLLGVTIGSMLVLHDDLLSFFLGAHSKAIEIAWRIQFRVVWSFVFLGITMILFAVMRASGMVLIPLMILLGSLVGVRVAFYRALYSTLGEDALWFSFPASTLTALILALLLYRRRGWRSSMRDSPAAGSLGNSVRGRGRPVATPRLAG